MEDISSSDNLPLSREERLKRAVLRIIKHTPVLTDEIWPAAGDNDTEAAEQKAAGSLPPVSQYLKDRGLAVYGYVLGASRTAAASDRFASLKERLSDPASPERQRLEDLHQKLSFLGSKALSATVQKREIFVGLVGDKMTKKFSGDLYIAKSDHGDESSSTFLDLAIDSPVQLSEAEILELEAAAESLDQRRNQSTDA